MSIFFFFKISDLPLKSSANTDFVKTIFLKEKSSYLQTIKYGSGQGGQMEGEGKAVERKSFLRQIYCKYFPM